MIFYIQPVCNQFCILGLFPILYTGSIPNSVYWVYSQFCILGLFPIPYTGFMSETTWLLFAYVIDNSYCRLVMYVLYLIFQDLLVQWAQLVPKDLLVVREQLDNLDLQGALEAQVNCPETIFYYSEAYKCFFSHVNCLIGIIIIIVVIIIIIIIITIITKII